MRYLVVGAGKSGVAAANFLAARGDEVCLTDASATPDLPYALDERVQRSFGKQDDAVPDSIETIVLSPGVPKNIPLLQRAAAKGIPIIAEV